MRPITDSRMYFIAKRLGDYAKEGIYAQKILHSFLESDILCPLEIF